MRRNGSVNPDKGLSSYPYTSNSLRMSSPTKEENNQYDIQAQMAMPMEGRYEDQKKPRRDYGLNLDYSSGHTYVDIDDKKEQYNGKKYSTQNERLTYQRIEPINEKKKSDSGLGDEIRRINKNYRDTDYRVEYYLRNSVNTDYETIKRNRRRKSIYNDNNDNPNVKGNKNNHNIQSCVINTKSHIPKLKSNNPIPNTKTSANENVYSNANKGMRNSRDKKDSIYNYEQIECINDAQKRNTNQRGQNRYDDNYYSQKTPVKREHFPESIINSPVQDNTTPAVIKTNEGNNTKKINAITNITYQMEQQDNDQMVKYLHQQRQEQQRNEQLRQEQQQQQLRSSSTSSLYHNKSNSQYNNNTNINNNNKNTSNLNSKQPKDDSNSSKNIKELIERLNQYRNLTEHLQKDKDQLETKYNSLREELIERKHCFINELQIKDQYIASLQQSIDQINHLNPNSQEYEHRLQQQHDQYESQINDYINQIEHQKKQLQLKDNELNQTLIDYQRDLQLVLDENEALKAKVVPPETIHDSCIAEIRRLNGLITLKKSELEMAQSKAQTNEKEKEEAQIAFDIEKNDLLNKITQLSNQETDNTQEIMNQCTKLKVENQSLRKEIDKLKLQQLDTTMSNQYEECKKINEDLNDKLEKKSKELKETKEIYNTLLTDYKKYQVEMKRKIEEMNNEINEEAKKTSEGIENTLKDDNDKKEALIKELNDGLRDKEAMINGLNDKIKDKDALIKKMILEKDAMEVQINQLKGTIREHEKKEDYYEDKLNNLMSDYDQANGKVSWLTKELNQLNSEKENDMKTIRELNECIEKTKKMNSLEINQLKELTSKMNESKEKDQESDDIKNRCHQLEDGNKKSNDTIDKLNKDIKGYQTQFEEASMKADRDHIRHQKELKQINDQLSQVKALLSQSNKAIETSATEVIQVKKQLDNCVKENDGLKKEMTAFQKYNDQYLDEIEKLKDNNVKLSKENTEVTNNITKLNKELGDKINEIKGLNGTVNELTEEVNRLNSDLSINKEQVKQLKALPPQSKDKNKEKEQAQTIEQSQSQIKKLQNDIAEIQKERSTLANTNEQLETKLKNLQSTYDQLKFESKYLNDKEKKAQQEVLTYQQKVVELNNSIQQLNKENNDLKDEVNTMKSTIDTLNNELNGLKDKMAQQKKDNEKIVLDLNAKLKRKSIREAEVVENNRTMTQEILILKEEISNLQRQTQSKEDNDKEKENEYKQEIEKEANQASMTINALQKQIEDLKSELITKEDIIGKLNKDKDKQILSLTEENKALSIEASLSKTQEAQIQKLKSENQLTFNQLKSQIDSNQDLLLELESKNKEIDNLKKEGTLTQNKPMISSIDSLGNGGEGDEEEGIEHISAHNINAVDNEELDKLKETIQFLQLEIKEKDEAIEELEKEKFSFEETIKGYEIELKSYKDLNDKLIEKNNKLVSGKALTEPNKMMPMQQHQYQESLTNVEDIEQEDIDSLHLTIANLRELIALKDKEVIELQQELEKEKEKEKEYAIRQSEPSLTKISSSSMTDAEKMVQYKKRLEEYRATVKSDQELIAVLKDEIRELKETLKNKMNFEGKIVNYEEFIRLYTVAFENYKPKKKEQEEAFRKLGEHLSGFSDEQFNKKIHKGLFNKFFK